MISAITTVFGSFADLVAAIQSNLPLLLLAYVTVTAAVRFPITE